MIHLYFQRREPQFWSRAGRVLHFAPEPQVRNLILSVPGLLYVMTTFDDCATQRFPGIAFRSDMQQLPIRDASFDSLFCLHVLEHVPDDRKGIQELRRILKPGGVAYIMAPFMPGWKATQEFGGPDPHVFDHVRGYSADDFSERLAGFACEVVKPGAFLTAEEMMYYGIPPEGEVLCRCVKP